MVLKKRTGIDGSQVNGHLPAEICDLADVYPSIWEHLSERRYPDGSERQTGTVLLLWEQGLFKAACIDREAAVTAFVSAPTLRGCLNALEKGLVEDSLEWRPSKGRPPRQRPMSAR